MYIRIIDNIPYDNGGMLGYGKNYRGEYYIVNVTDEEIHIMEVPNLTERTIMYGTQNDRKPEDR